MLLSPLAGVVRLCGSANDGCVRRRASSSWIESSDVLGRLISGHVDPWYCDLSLRLFRCQFCYRRLTSSARTQASSTKGAVEREPRINTPWRRDRQQKSTLLRSALKGRESSEFGQ